MKATHKEIWISVDGQKEPIFLKPGQFITGRDSLWRDYYPKKVSYMKSPKTLWRWMQILENMQNLTINSSNKFSIISIVNWSIYQCDNKEDVQQDVQQMSNRCPTDVQQMSTNKNNKNNKNTTYVENEPEIDPSSNGKVPYQEMIDAYHEILPELSGVRKLTDKRKAQVKKLWMDKDMDKDMDRWRAYLQHIRGSKFLMGCVPGRDWQADFEWITNYNNFVKIIENKYHK